MILVPDWLWMRLLDEFRKTAPSFERVAYLDGARTEWGGVVTTLTVPNATLAPLWFEVSADAMSEAGKHLRGHRLVRLAQVHTHGGEWVGHSETDDRRAYSQVPGAVSMVLPYHGRKYRDLTGAGIHVRREHDWEELDSLAVPSFFRLVPTVLDFRRS